MAKILIAGCGDIGARLARLLSEQGHQVTGLRRQPPPNAADQGCQYLQADLTRPEDLDALPLDFDQVYFMPAPGGRDPQAYHAVYVQGLQGLLAHFQQAAQPPHWIMVSSTSVYGQQAGEWVDECSMAEPLSASSACIRTAEQLLLAANPDYIVLRCSGIYGPGREYLLTKAQQAPEIQRFPEYFTN